MLTYQVLGRPGDDNSLFVRVESGQRVTRLLFDCGQDCLAGLLVGEVQALDHVLFSHFHMDHISGFDALFRLTYNRPTPMHLWGPPDASRILHHRFQGFLWNLYADSPGTWYVHEIHAQQIQSFRFEAAEAFATAHPTDPEPFNGPIIDRPDVSVDALHLNHGTPSRGYLVREPARLNVDLAQLQTRGLIPGPWLQVLKEADRTAPTMLEVGGVSYERALLQRELLVETPGQSLAYLTDFRLDEPALETLADSIHGCTTLICESQYRAADTALADRNYHLTTTQAARLAQCSEADQLVLFHLSRRYQENAWQEMLAEAQRIFPNTTYPDTWFG